MDSLKLKRGRTKYGAYNFEYSEWLNIIILRNFIKYFIQNNILIFGVLYIFLIIFFVIKIIVF